MQLLVFGYGYTARALAARLRPEGWRVTAAVRDGADIPKLADEGVEAVQAGDEAGLTILARQASAVLVTAPPGPAGCPGLAPLVRAMARGQAFPDWIGYLSTTGVYGDRHGGWVFEESRLAAQSLEGARRVGAERDWLEIGQGMGLTVTVFRLPGIYGPGRSALERLREGAARRIVQPGQVFSRVHVEDLARGLACSIARPRAGGIYNLCDDLPCPNSEVIAYAAELLGLEPPPEITPEEADLSAAARRFYAESKRVSNARAKAELGWRPRHPTYREGLRAIFEAGG